MLFYYRINCIGLFCCKYHIILWMRILWVLKEIILYITVCNNKKHLKNVGPIRHNEPPNANSPDVASGTVARRLRIDVHDNDDNDNDNAWQRGPLWPRGMGPITREIVVNVSVPMIVKCRKWSSSYTDVCTRALRLPSSSAAPKQNIISYDIVYNNIRYNNQYLWYLLSYLLSFSILELLSILFNRGNYILILIYMYLFAVSYKSFNAARKLLFYYCIYCISLCWCKYQIILCLCILEF